MQRHMEDLGNRGRRNNLRVRGVPESIEYHQIQQCIEMERIHRALRPKGRDTDPPRDIICFLTSFSMKKEILRKARNRINIAHESADIKRYQGLSNITLQHCKDLRPLLDVLRTRGIHYKWKFPFCLSASTAGRTAPLKVLEDLPKFCDRLGFPMVQIPDWYAEF